jgi:hypothetical protein
MPAPMNEVFPLGQAQAGYDRMMSGKARFASCSTWELGKRPAQRHQASRQRATRSTEIPLRPEVGQLGI